MNATKQKILIKSLSLFNDEGISKISLRDISNFVNISVGNLQYHFKKREDIIEALYFQLAEKIDQVILLNENNLFKSFLELSTEVFSIMYGYRFFFLDFVSVVRNNSTIKAHYCQLSLQREAQFKVIVDVLIKNGILREAELKQEYLNLYRRIEVMSNFWFSSVLIKADTLSKGTIRDYASVIGQNIYPYLTEKSKAQYAKLYPEQFS